MTLPHVPLGDITVKLGLGKRSDCVIAEQATLMSLHGELKQGTTI